MNKPQPNILPDGRMDTQNAALYLGYSKGYLHNMRVTGDGPKFTKVRGKVFYRRPDLDEWLDTFGTSRTTAQARLRKAIRDEF